MILTIYSEVNDNIDYYISLVVRDFRLNFSVSFFRCPKTVENFSTHSVSGYYNTHIFHRVIHQFMIQTGDPLGKAVLIKRNIQVHVCYTEYPNLV